MADKKSNNIATLEKAFRIIELMAEQKSDMSAIEISTRLRIQKSTLNRFLKTLESLGYIEQNPSTKKYTLSYNFLAITKKLINKYDFFDQVSKYSNYFTEKYSFAVSIAVFSKKNVYHIHTNDNSYILTTQHQCGYSFNKYATAPGKLLLSTYNDDQIKDFFDNTVLIPMTHNTIIDPEKLIKELEIIRKQGYATQCAEYSDFSVSLAIPVYAVDNSIIGTVIFKDSVDRKDILFSENVISEIKKIFDNIRIVK